MTIKLTTTNFIHMKSLDPEIVPVSIALINPKHLNMLSYRKLAPTKYTLEMFHKTRKEDEYIQRYFHQTLNKLNFKEVLKELVELTGSTNIALVCYESKSKFCHRHIVIRWILYHLGIDIVNTKFIPDDTYTIELED
ncbi:MAG: DUF488 domain-containing protein [Herbinix sp.]|nr:DUF488 domain-containing protein [Herbinix sp.]